MSPDRKYTKLIAALKGSKPVLHGKEEFVDKILEQTLREKEHINKIYDFIFGWIEIIWLRRTLLTASLIILTLFIFQQFIIFERIGSLESRMTGMNTEMLIDYQKEMARVNSAILEISDIQKGNDSIKVSARDLNEMIKAYRKLQEEFFSERRIIRESDELHTNPVMKKIKL